MNIKKFFKKFVLCSCYSAFFAVVFAGDAWINIEKAVLWDNHAQKFIEYGDPDGVITGYSNNSSRVKLTGHAGGYDKNDSKIYIQAEKGSILLGIIKADGSWEAETILGRHGIHKVKLWIINTEGKKFKKNFTAYLSGTTYPQQGSRSVPIPAFYWKAYSGSGNMVKQSEIDSIYFQAASSFGSGLEKASKFYNAPAGSTIKVYNPDGTENRDLEMARLIREPRHFVVIPNWKVPDDGEFFLCLKNKFHGVTFLYILGALECENLRKYRLEIGKGNDPGSFEQVRAGDEQIKSDFTAARLGYIASKRMFGDYTIRTLMQDAKFHRELEEIDRASFTVGMQAGWDGFPFGGIEDPYREFYIRIPRGKLKETKLFNIYVDDQEPVQIEKSGGHKMLTSKFCVEPGLLQSDCVENPEKFTVGIRYNNDQMVPENIDGLFDLDKKTMTAGAYKTAFEKAISVIRDNISIYREFPDSAGNSMVEMVKSVNDYQWYRMEAEQDDVRGNYFIFPSNSAPVFIDGPKAEPGVFGGSKNPVTIINYTPASASMKYLFADVRVYRAGDNTAPVSRIPNTGGDRLKITLSYAGNLSDGITAEAGPVAAKKLYFYKFYRDAPGTAVPERTAVWNGMENVNGAEKEAPDGKYTVVVTLYDAAGNSTTGACEVVKSAEAVAIEKIGGVEISGSVIKTVRPDSGENSVIIAGKINLPPGTASYRIAYRPSYIREGMAEGLRKYYGLDKNHGYIDITDRAEKIKTMDSEDRLEGKIAVWNLKGLSGGSYDLTVFLLDDKGGVVYQDSVYGITIAEEPGK